mmetsp:Transcript_23488/g.65314  ORF Transcript_23488/g.65314 Transcript_23488/m.65314 type:complete len:228 (-) Transcript_23488:732-1415(-)
MLLLGDGLSRDLAVPPCQPTLLHGNFLWRWLDRHRANVGTANPRRRRLQGQRQRWHLRVSELRCHVRGRWCGWLQWRSASRAKCWLLLRLWRHGWRPQRRGRRSADIAVASCVPSDASDHGATPQRSARRCGSNGRGWPRAEGWRAPALRRGAPARRRGAPDMRWGAPARCRGGPCRSDRPRSDSTSRGRRRRVRPLVGLWRRATGVDNASAARGSQAAKVPEPPRC